MSKLFTKEKDRHIDVLESNNKTLIFIQDDTSYPSKIVSVKLSANDTEKLINNLQKILNKLQAK